MSVSLCNGMIKLRTRLSEVFSDVIRSGRLPIDKRAHCLGILFYSELLHIFYRLRVSDYKNAVKHVDKLDAAMKQDSKNMNQQISAGNDSLKPTYFGNVKRALKDKLFLTPPPFNGE